MNTRKGPFNVRVEALAEVLPELVPFLVRHWDEIGHPYLESKELRPRYAVYLEMEARGECLAIVMRDIEGIAGYWIGFLAPELHHETTLAATTDIFYLEPDVRGGAAALRLFRTVERILRANGVMEWYTDVPLHRDSGRLFEALGHVPVARYYCKKLEV